MVLKFKKKKEKKTFSTLTFPMCVLICLNKQLITQHQAKPIELLLGR